MFLSIPVQDVIMAVGMVLSLALGAVCGLLS